MRTTLNMVERRQRGKANRIQHQSGVELILHGVRITHPERVVYDKGGTTKGEVAQYYAAVAPLLPREIARRLISLLRCPSGIQADCFYQRNVGAGLGKHVHPFAWNYTRRNSQYMYVTNAPGIMEIVQMGVIEIHPWGATIDNIHAPDRMIFDLDPDPTVPFSAIKATATDIRLRLKTNGLVSLLKWTGGKGLHIVVSLSPIKSWDDVKGWASAFSHDMVNEASERFVATMAKSKRAGKIFIDFFRNDYRPRALPPVRCARGPERLLPCHCHGAVSPR